MGLDLSVTIAQLVSYFGWLYQLVIFRAVASFPKNPVSVFIHMLSGPLSNSELITIRVCLGLIYS